MIFTTIRNSGELGIEFHHDDGDGARVSRDFIEQLIRNIIKKSTQYYDETKDYVFAYSEKQLHSVICPSIESIADAHLFEHPLIRKPAGEESYRGYVDYWISYRNYTFLMELKHVYFAYKNFKKPRKKIYIKYEKAMQQLKNIPIEQCRSLTENKGLVKIALEAIIFYRGSKTKELFDTISEDFPFLFKQMIINTGLSKKIKFSSIWLLDETMTQPYHFFEQKYFEVYPALGFIGHISESIY